MLEHDDTNSWPVYPELGLEDIQKTISVANQLEALAPAVWKAPKESLEAYALAFNAIVGEDLKPAKTVSVEAFEDALFPSQAMANRITQHGVNLRLAIEMSLEDFNKDALGKFGQIVENYRRARSQLDDVKTELQPVDNIVKVNHDRVWKLFNKNNKFVKPDSIREDVMDVQKIIHIIEGAAADLNGNRPVELDTAKFELMMNTFVTIEGNSIKFDSPEPPKPKDEYSAGDIGWIVAWGVIFNVIGLLGALIFKKKTASESDRKRGVNEMLGFINTVKGFDKSIAELERLIKSIQQTEENKEMAAVLIDAAVKLTKHITDVTFGAAVLFTKIAKS